MVNKELLTSTKDLNLYLNSTVEPQLRNLVEVVDLQALKGRIAKIDEYEDTLTEYEVSEEIGEIPESQIGAAGKADIEIKYLSKIIKVKHGKFDSKCEIETNKAFKRKAANLIVKTENVKIIEKFNDEAVDTTEANFLETLKTKGYNTIINSNIVSNEAFFKVVNTVENIEKNIFKNLNGKYYYNNIPMYVIKNNTMNSTDPLAIVGDLKSVGICYKDSKNPYKLAVSDDITINGVDFLGRVDAYFETVNLKSDYIKLKLITVQGVESNV